DLRRSAIRRGLPGAEASAGSQAANPSCNDGEVVMSLSARLRTALLLLSLLAFAPAVLAQEGVEPAATPHHGGGEASLVLPDLSSVSFMGVNGHSLLSIGLVVCALGR